MEQPYEEEPEIPEIPEEAHEYGYQGLGIVRMTLRLDTIQTHLCCDIVTVNLQRSWFLDCT